MAKILWLSYFEETNFSENRVGILIVWNVPSQAHVLIFTEFQLVFKHSLTKIHNEYGMSIRSVDIQVSLHLVTYK